MAKSITVVPYNDSYSERWDRFILDASVNGTFLQTRRFLSYHEGAEKTDSSILFMNGNEIIAVSPANTVFSDDVKTYFSHDGSTFGGLIIDKRALNISYMDLIMNAFEDYLRDKGYDRAILRQTGDIFNKTDTSLLEYYLFLYDYSETKELGYYIDFSQYAEDILSGFSSSRRRDYRYSLKNEPLFRELTSITDIEAFYSVLCDNYCKFGKKPIHTLEHINDFKFNRLKEETRLFGVYVDNRLVAGCMAFIFGDMVFHTQYLAVLQGMKDLFINEYMYKSLIELARNEGFKCLSFGTSTFEQGHILNSDLAKYKEGYGAITYINRTYTKTILK